VSGAVCGATIYGAVEQPLIEGAVLGGVGAIAGAFAGSYGRKRFSRGGPDLRVAVLEDVFSNRRRRSDHRSGGARLKHVP
jgi:uncharacterized membrane protein